MTKDEDFKALVRARMAKTGESYTAAREQLLLQQADRDQPAPPPASTAPDGGRFGLGFDKSAFTTARRQAESMADNLYDNAGIDITTGVLRVWMGDPPSFEIAIPRDAIKRVERAPDMAGGSLGVHGMRGRWLVNGAYTGLVRLTFDRPVKADLRVQSVVPEEFRERAPWFLRPLMRDRSPKVRELTLSLDDPDSFVSALQNT